MVRRFVILFFLFTTLFLYSQETELLAENEIEIQQQEDSLLTEEALVAEKIEEEEPEAFFIDRSQDYIRFIQRLTWEPAAYSLYYEVIIERFEEEGYAEMERITVDVTFVEVSLPAGYYRYKIDVYDLLGELSYESRWLEFEIKRALQPTISSFSPAAFYLDEPPTNTGGRIFAEGIWILTLRGQNIIPESEIWLVQGNTRITPRRIIGEGTTAHLEFSSASLVQGEYQIYARNPGGLDYTAVETFLITNKKPFDLNFSIGYAPIIPIGGFLFDDHELEAPFPAGFFPLSFALKANFIPYKASWGSLGADFSVSYSYLKYEREFYTASSSFLNTHLSFLYQRYFLNRMFAVNVNVGFGLSSLFSFKYEYPIGPPAENTNAIYPSFTGGVSLMYNFRRPFFVHGGLDFVQMLSAGEDVPLPNFLRPFVAVGMMF